ncbi:hypothetical protein FOVSG1_010964 [Fusarium oxysporum f. sp. vasinfectum]
MSDVGKFVIWLAQFVQLADWIIEKRDENIAKKLKDDSIFVFRLFNWAFGSIGVLGRCWSRYEGNIGGVTLASGQLFCLGWVIVESIDVKGHILRCWAEEWLKAIRKFGTHVSGTEDGTDPYYAGLFYALLRAGNMMSMIRAVDGTSLYSGVDRD